MFSFIQEVHLIIQWHVSVYDSLPNEPLDQWTFGPVNQHQSLPGNESLQCCIPSGKKILRLWLNVHMSQFRLSSVCLSVVCNVGAPYSGGWTFRQYFFIAVYAGHPLTSVQNFTDIVLYGKPSAGSVKRKRGIKIERFWTYRRLYLINGTR